MNHFDHVTGPSIPVNENPAASSEATETARSAAIRADPQDASAAARGGPAVEGRPVARHRRGGRRGRAVRLL